MQKHKNNTNPLLKEPFQYAVTGLVFLGLFIGFLHKYGDIFNTEIGSLLFLFCVGFFLLKKIYDYFQVVIYYILEETKKNPQTEFNEVIRDSSGFERITKEHKKSSKHLLKQLGLFLGFFGFSGMIVKLVLGGFVVSLWMFATALMPIALLFLCLFVQNMKKD